MGRGLAADVHGGAWRPAMGNSDTHLEGQIGQPQTVVLAEELSNGAVLAGLRAGRSWIAESSAVELSLKVAADDHSAGIGERLGDVRRRRRWYGQTISRCAVGHGQLPH